MKKSKTIICRKRKQRERAGRGNVFLVPFFLPPSLALSLSLFFFRSAEKTLHKKTERKGFALSLTPLLAEARSASRALRDAAASAGLQQRRRSAAAARRRAAASADASSSAAAAAAAAAWTAAADDAIVGSPAPSAAPAPAPSTPRGLPPRRRRPGLLPGAAARAEAPDHGVQGHQGEN